MLERLHIQNYRVFNDLKIDQLSRHQPHCRKEQFR